MAVLEPTGVETNAEGVPNPRSVLNTNAEKLNDQQVRYIQELAGENLAIYQTVYQKNDGKLWKAQASNAYTLVPCVGMVIEAKNADQNVRAVYQGEIENSDPVGSPWNLTIGDVIYLSTVVGGWLSTTDPADIDGANFAFSQIIGIATGAESMYIDCSMPWYSTIHSATTVIFDPRATDPGAIGTRGALYTKNDGGTIKLYYEDNGANVVCLSDSVGTVSLRHVGDYAWLTEISHIEFGCGTIVDEGGGYATYTPDKFGDVPGGNYISVASDGQMTFLGDARVSRHMVFGPASWKLGSTAPTASFENLFPTLIFATGADDAAHYSTWVPWRWDNTTDMTVKVFWRHDNVAQTGKVLWTLTYLGCVAGEDPSGVGTTISILTDGNHPQDQVIETTFVTKMLAANLARHDILALKFWRDGAASADTLGEGAEMISVHIEFTLNRIGEPV